MTSIKTAPEARTTRAYGYRPDGVEPCCPPLELIADPGSEFWARQHAADILHTWGLEHLGGLVDPLVAEMVLNGIRYVGVGLRRTGAGRPHADKSARGPVGHRQGESGRLARAGLPHLGCEY